MASRPTQRAWQPAEMATWLRELQTRADAAHGSEDSVYIHPHPLRFTTEHQKNEWDGYYNPEDLAVMDSFGRLEKAKKGSRKTWVAVVVGPSATYVGKKKAAADEEQWDQVDNHMWAVAVVSCGGKGAGKNLYIFDCDAELGGEKKQHAKDLATQLQRVFVAAVKK